MIDWAHVSLRDLAGYVSEELKKKGIDAVLVGGACVTIEGLGFMEKQKYFQHEDFPWFIEFVASPVAVGNEPIFKFNHLKTPLGTIQMLTPLLIVSKTVLQVFTIGMIKKA